MAIIMRAAQYIERLKVMAARRTYYMNKWPDNLCYVHTDGRTSADCLNLPKALFNGYDVNNNTVGYYQRDLSNTGEFDEIGLLNQCSGVSSDFKNIKAPAILYMNRPNGHIGTYIGITPDNRFNVIECTSSYGGGIIYSWVDQDGTRRSENGGQPIVMKDGTYIRWQKYGYPTKWVAYNNEAITGSQDNILPTLKRGDKGSAVKKLQELLVAKGYNPNGIDGEFGPGCEKAVKQYQKDNGLTADGIVGPKTWEKLLAVSKPIEVPKEEPKNDKPILKKGSKGGSVDELKMLLINHGEVPFDNVFDDSTLKAVKEFQKKNGLEVDGCVGPKTWAALLK